MQSLTDPKLVGLPEEELEDRMQRHRGVYCQPGLLNPTTTTIYHVCLAQEFNKMLPLGRQHKTTNGGSTIAATAPASVPLEELGTNAPSSSEVSPSQKDGSLGSPAPAPAEQLYCSSDGDKILAAMDCGALQEYANRRFATTQGFFYVLQLELDLLVPPLTSIAGMDLASDLADKFVCIDGGVNWQAITRIWLAGRGSMGGKAGNFIQMAPPVGGGAAYEACYTGRPDNLSMATGKQIGHSEINGNAA